MAGNRAHFAQQPLKLYKTLIKPVMTYGLEAWSMSATDDNALCIFGMVRTRVTHGKKANTKKVGTREMKGRKGHGKGCKGRYEEYATGRWWE